ncbi:hypothetical protein K3495_g6375 [Podosphaera aphanis]|nr:hypothetical protein K3495_g6375 [Podosphaera aphanis]
MSAVGVASVDVGGGQKWMGEEYLAMADVDLQEVHDLLVSVAYEAGRIMLLAKPSSSNGAHGTKKNSADLVTETDQAVEKHVSKRLLSAYPSFQFIGEETYDFGQQLTDEYTFIVDPIDGTTNFVHGYPAFCISLGVAFKKKPIIGVIYNPSNDELYTAIQGCGAYLQKGLATKQRLPLGGAEPLQGLSSCLIGVEWGSDRTGDNFALKSEVFTKLVASKESGGAMVQSLRYLGSTALSLAAVAAGQLDAFWEGGSWAWDVCAGLCIVKESGGLVTDTNAGQHECELMDRRYFAVRAAPEAQGQKEIVHEFWKLLGDKKLDYSKSF